MYDAGETQIVGDVSVEASEIVPVGLCRNVRLCARNHASIWIPVGQSAMRIKDLWRVADEEPCAVADDWTAESRCPELVRTTVPVRPEEPGAAIKSTGQEMTRTSLKCRWSPRQPELTVIFVGATLRHNVDNATSCATKLSLEA